MSDVHIDDSSSLAIRGQDALPVKVEIDGSNLEIRGTGK